MKFLILFLLNFSSIALIAQKNRDSLFLANLPNWYITPDEKNQNKQGTLPFHSITIKDARLDTTSIGFLENNLDRTFELHFKNGLVTTLGNYLKQHYSLTNGTNNLLILIKEFRVSEYAIKGAVKDVSLTCKQEKLLAYKICDFKSLSRMRINKKNLHIFQCRFFYMQIII